ncbi:MAG: transcription elongation factor GreA [Candidatus Omnitrophota bacterium]|nr:transcription elongation factor GreA [Candidatus Omnitrophota bacterium]
MNKVVMTQEGYEKMMEELGYLKSTKRKEIAEQLATARAHGDLKENAEYDAAKEAKRHLETKIASLELKLSQAKIVDLKDVDQSKSFLGATLKLKNLASGDVVSYTLVTEDEANIDTGKISITSPIGKGLLGKSTNEKAEIQVPSGKITFEVQEISYG